MNQRGNRENMEIRKNMATHQKWLWKSMCLPGYIIGDVIPRHHIYMCKQTSNTIMPMQRLNRIFIQTTWMSSIHAITVDFILDVDVFYLSTLVE